MKKVMLDLETLGLKPGSVVLTIGAVLFDHECAAPWVGQEERFHVRMDADIQHAVGLRTDPDTALWWLEQDRDAQQALLDMNVVDARQALAMFADWLEALVGTPPEDQEYLDVEVWSNGANFDGVLLREVYDALGLKCPWAWFNERCYRTERKTLKRLLGRAVVYGSDPEFNGVQHDALHDAVHQASVICELESRLIPRLT